MVSGPRVTFVSPIIKLAASLNIFGGGRYRRQAGAGWSVTLGQSTVSRILREIMESEICESLNLKETILQLLSKN